MTPPGSNAQPTLASDRLRAGHPASSPVEGADRCPTCGTALAGDWCHGCGAPRPDLRPLTVARFAHELAHEVTSVDSVTMATMRSLFLRPGQLTAAYVAGQTRRYLSPLRIYLLTFAAMILVLSATPAGSPYSADRFNRGVEQKERDDGEMRRLVAKAARSVNRTPEQLIDDASAGTARLASSPLMHLLDPLAVAGVVALLYRRRRRGYAEHVVFALHVLAFNSIITIVTQLLHHAAHGARPLDLGASAVHWLLLGTYVFIAARVTHGESRARTGVKTLGFLVGSQLAYTIVPILSVLIVLTQIFVLRV